MGKGFTAALRNGIHFNDSYSVSLKGRKRRQKAGVRELLDIIGVSGG